MPAKSHPIDDIRPGSWRRLRGYLFDRFFTKMFSLLFALVVWLYVNTRGEVIEQLIVPIAYQGRPESLAFVESPPSEIEVRIRGREPIIRNLNTSAVSIVVNLSGARAGENQFVIGSKNISLPAEVDVRQISPKFINLKMEPVISKRVKVIPDIVGHPAAGTRVEKIDLQPSHVTLRGPKSVVEGMDRVRSLSIDLDGVDKSFEASVGLNLSDGRIEVAGADPKIVVRVMMGGRPRSSQTHDN